MNRPAAIADHRQAEYFLHLLAQICRRINHRIDMYERAGVAFDGDELIEHPWGSRQLARLDEQDRRVVQELVDHLQQRFPSCSPGEVFPIPRKAQAVLR